MEDHSSLRYSDGEDDKTDLEVSSILLELSQPVYFSYDPSPCSLKWGRTKKRTFSDIMPPPRISSEPVIQPQPMTEVVGSNYSSSYSTGDAKKTNSQSSRNGLEEGFCMTSLKLKQTTSSQPSASSSPVLKIQADTGLSTAQAVAPPAQPSAKKGRRRTNGQNLRPLRPLMIRDDRTDNAKLTEGEAFLLEARLNMERRGFNQEPTNNNMERRRSDFALQPRDNNMERRDFVLQPRNNNKELSGFNVDPRNHIMERRRFDLELVNNIMEERRGFNLEPRHNNMELRDFDLQPRNNNMEPRGFDVEASRNKNMEWLRFDLIARQNHVERRGVELEARRNNVGRRGFDLNLLPAAEEEVNHRDAVTVSFLGVVKTKEEMQAAAQARNRRLRLRQSKKKLQKSASVSPNK